jgi:hypothetical protein
MKDQISKIVKMHFADNIENNACVTVGGHRVNIFFFFKEVARGGERTRVLSISFIFSFFATLPLSHSGSPKVNRLCAFSHTGQLFTLGSCIENFKSSQNLGLLFNTIKFMY